MGCCQVPSCRSDRIAPRNPSVDVGTTMRPWKGDRKSTRLNSSHSQISYAVFCLKKKKLHVAGVELDRDLEGPWIAPTAPPGDILDLALWVAERAPKLLAVTFDAFSPILTDATVLRSVVATRRAFGLN